MEFFVVFYGIIRLIRSLPSQSPDKSEVMGGIVPNCSAFRKRNPSEPEKRPATVL